MHPDTLQTEVPREAVLSSPTLRRKPFFHMEVRTVDEAAVVKCTGRLVYREEAATLICKVNDLLPDYRHIILDFAGVESIDSSGLGSLAMLCLWAKDAGGAIRLCSLRPRVERMLRLTNLNSVLEVHSTETGALASHEPALI